MRVLGTSRPKALSATYWQATEERSRESTSVFRQAQDAHRAALRKAVFLRRAGT
jgi:hypothetical protein